MHAIISENSVPERVEASNASFLMRNAYLLCPFV